MKKRFILREHRHDIRVHAMAYIDNLPNNEEWDITVKPYKKSKSQEQLGYLWGVVLPAICRRIEDSTGKHYTTDDVYSWMVSEYSVDRVVTISGKPKVTKVSASKMTVKDMSVFIDKIIQHAAMYMNLPIPPAEREYEEG